MTPAPPPLLSLAIDPRARLLLFDIADDPAYAAVEIQVFDDDVHGRGVLVLLARHDGKVDVYRQHALRVDPGSFSIGRGLGEWREAAIDPARFEVFDDGVVVDVALEDAAGRPIEVRIDDRDGATRTHSTLLAPVSSGVESPQHLLVVLLREFDLVRTSGMAPRLSIGGVSRTMTALPGPGWIHHRRFIRYSEAPVIATMSPAIDGPVEVDSLGPVERLVATSDAASAAVRFDPPLPDLRTLVDGVTTQGAWDLTVGDEAGLFGGTWTTLRAGDTVRVTMAVTRPWRPRGLPLSLRMVTTVAKVFRAWPMTYAWTAVVDLAATPPTATTAWSRASAPDQENAYGVRAGQGRLLAAGGVVVALAGLALLVAIARCVGKARRRR